jgi:tetratricopeptide (TPR) repeat protein
MIRALLLVALAQAPGPAAAPPPDAAPLVAPAPEPAPDPAAARRDHAAGTARLRAGQVGEAVELYRSAHALDPKAAFIANDLGFALSKLGARREAETMYRRALDLDPRRWLAYVNLLELMTDSPERWQRRDELLGFVDRAMLALREEPHGRFSVLVAAAELERSVGRLAAARRRLELLPPAGLALQLRKRANDTLRAIEEDERALALADWPESPLPPEAAAALRKAEEHLLAGHTTLAIDLAGGLILGHPTASAARFLRARALAALARHDEAKRELLLLLQLRPSHAGAWRLLGTILAEHGGVLEAERADEALGKALALEPSWHDLREIRRQVALKRAPAGSGRAARVSPPPSARAQALLIEAQRWVAHDVPSMAQTVLLQALADSPGYVEAAASLFSLGGAIQPMTVQALWGDGDALGRLATELLKIRHDDDVLRMVGPWLDRAVELGAIEARFERAVLRAGEGDTAGALADLQAYVGSAVEPARLAEARALRTNLEPALREGTPVALARRHLLAGRPDEAAKVLGGACRRGLPAESLIELGRIAEYKERIADAVDCHHKALAAGREPERRTALDRLARIAARTPLDEHPAGLAADLQAARRAGVPAAEWALAREAAAHERWDEAVTLGERFLRATAADDPLREDAARTLIDLRNQADDRQVAQAARVRLGLVLVALSLSLVGLIAIGRRLRGRSVTAALARLPDLYPEVAPVIAEIRHDVLKHRASALGMLGTPDAPRAEVARALLEPTPTSAVVAAAFERLSRAAAAAGVPLRPLSREPLFGPLHRALARAEALLAGGNSASRAADRELLALDRELRERHGPALAALLAVAPRTRLDPAAVAAWLRPVADGAGRGAAVTPGLHLAALDVDLPITAAALETIVANLVRNAVAAARGAADPRVLLRVEETQDAAGRRLVTFLVADSAPTTVALDEIERRDGGRGLGIVRDLVRRWGGHLVVRREPAPFQKAIGAAFPIARETGVEST